MNRLVHRLAYNGDVVAFKMGPRLGKRVGGSAYWRIGVWEVRLLFDPYESRYGRFETTVYRKRYFGQQQRYRCTLEGGLVNRNIVNN